MAPDELDDTATDSWDRPAIILRITRTDGPPREFRISGRQVRRLRAAALALAVLLVVLVASLGATLPGSLAYGGLVKENLALKTHLREVDRRMAEIERLLLRLRLYDAQLESLSDPRGDHGPVSPGMLANARIDDVQALEPQDALLLGGEGTPSDVMLRPAESWASSIQARAETFLALFAEAEPDLNAFVEQLEGLRALERALPSSWPARGRLTSGYGWRRHPLRQTWGFHSGLDVANHRGTPIHAASAGTVVKAEYNDGYGRMIEIDHGYGITTLYAHCHALHVKKGDRVERGQHICDMGSTGRSTGPHLHFEVRLDGHAVDPMDYLSR